MRNQEKIVRLIPPLSALHPVAGKERALLSALGRASASLTLEAAAILPVFLGLISAVLYFLVLISLQSDIQLRTDEAAREIGKRAYAAESSDVLGSINTNPLTVRAQILQGNLKARADRSQISGGSNGMSTLLSSYDSESGILDVSVIYQYRFPFISAIISEPYFRQHMRCRAWIGREIAKDGSVHGADDDDDNESDEEIVYITPTGTAYHSSADCSYLDLTIRPAPYATVDFMRNLDGGIYYRCPACAAQTDPEVVYVTDYGTNWHASLACSGLKRTVMAVKLSEVGGRHPCHKCYGEH